MRAGDSSITKSTARTNKLNQRSRRTSLMDKRTAPSKQSPSARQANRLQAQLGRVLALVRASNSPRMHLGFDELGRSLRESLAPIAGIEKFSLFLSRTAGAPLSMIACGGVTESEFEDVTVSPGEGTVGAVVVTGTPFFATGRRRTSESESATLLAGLPVVACLPVKTSTETVGVLVVHQLASRALGKEQREMLTLSAEQLGPAIETILMREEMARYSESVQRANVDIENATRDLERQISHLHTLSLFAVTLHSSLDLPEVFDQIRRLSMSFLGVDRFHTVLVHEGEWITYHGAADETIVEDELREGLGKYSRFVERVLVSGQPYFRSLEEHADPPQTADDCPIACLPLKVKDENAGVFLVESLMQGATEFTEDQLELLRLLTEQAALALTAAYLYNKVEQMAISDGLTGLYDRRHIEHLMRREISRARRYDEPLGIAMADIDGFKQINDTYGHPLGDTVLKEIAKAFRAACREGDIVGRYGGEEFLFILPRSDAAGTAALGERIRAAAEQLTLAVHGKAVHVTVSVGTTVFPGYKTWEELIKAADSALYAAKQRGKNCVVTVTEENNHPL